MTRSRGLGAVAALVMALTAASAGAQTPFVPSQAGNTVNQEVTSAVNATAVITLTAALHTRAHVYLVTARCTNGTAQVTITDGGVQKWSSPPSIVGPTQINQAFTPGWTGSLGAVVLVTLGSCGGGNVGTINVVADVY